MSDRPASGETPEILVLEDGTRLAYHRSPGTLPGVVFLGGLASDMTGTKATALEAYCRRRGQAFLRFDYSGHGGSSGRFEDGTIGRWAADATAALDALTEGPQVLVGSSLGGWIMLLLALRRIGRVTGLLGVAAAPDFTEDLLWGRFSPEARETLQREGLYRMPSDYGEPLPITRRLIEEGREHLLLRGSLPIACPVRLLQGMADPDVPWDLALKLAEHLQSEDVEITLIKRGDHRLSEPPDLERLTAALGRLLDHVAGLAPVGN